MSHANTSTVLTVNNQAVRTPSFDYIKAFAIFAVVTIHTAPFGGMAAQNPLFDFIFIVINGAARFGVPIFFAISGYLIGRKLKGEFPLRSLKKFLVKTLKIYVLSVMVYYGSYWLLHEAGLSAPLDKKEFSPLMLLYYGPYHMWFLTSLFYSILIASCFYYKRLINILLAISALLFILGLFGQSYKIFWSIDIQTRDALFFGLFFTTLGMKFASMSKDSFFMISNRALVVLVMVSIILQSVEAYVLREMGASPGNYYISTALSCFFLMLLAIRLPEMGKESLWLSVGKNTLGIFIIHPLLMKMASSTITYKPDLYVLILWQFLYPFIVTAACYYILRLISSYGRLFRGVTAA